jgi:hypothetical protein
MSDDQVFSPVSSSMPTGNEQDKTCVPESTTLGDVERSGHVELLEAKSVGQAVSMSRLARRGREAKKQGVYDKEV